MCQQRCQQFRGHVSAYSQQLREHRVCEVNNYADTVSAQSLTTRAREFSGCLREIETFRKLFFALPSGAQVFLPHIKGSNISERCPFNAVEQASDSNTMNLNTRDRKTSHWCRFFL